MATYSSDKPQVSSGIETGTIVEWTTATIPTGFLVCDGSNVSRTTYAALFAVIGTTYGSGDGSTTFGLPDLEDRIPIGKSSTYALASTGGAASVTLSTAQLPAHGHTITSGSGAFAGDLGLVQCPEGSDGNKYGTGDDARDASSEDARYRANNTGSGSSVSVLQPYIALNFMIKT